MSDLPVADGLSLTLLTRYGPKGASSRVRFEQFMPLLRSHGIQVVRHALLDDAYLSEFYAGRRSMPHVVALYARQLLRIVRQPGRRLLWVEKELLPFLPAWMERALLGRRPYVIDYDDATFHTYDHSRSAWVRRLLGRKIDGLMRHATTVTVGNSYLERRAHQAGAPRVVRLPSVVDLDRYPAPIRRSPIDPSSSPLSIVWIGTPATVRYLERVKGPITELSRRRSIELRVIGAPAPPWPGVSTRSVPWASDTEAREISFSDIGIMPLDDTPWERGKCGFKLVQYMACGLPVVASPVGMNVDIVAPGANGYLAADGEQWFHRLELLASDAALRERLGRHGRARVEAEYSVQVLAPKIARLLKEAAAGVTEAGPLRRS
jgi:glycosyltransferase involved in cell wall biosynthesis